MDESDVQVVGGGGLGGEQAAQQALFLSFLGSGNVRVCHVGGDGDGLLQSQDLHVGPDGFQTLLQLVHGHFAQLVEGVDLQPDQKGVSGGGHQVHTAKLIKGLLEEGEPGEKAAAFLIGPDMVRFKAHGGLELGKAAGLREVHAVEPGELVKLEELIVALDLRLLAVDGEETDHIAGDGGGLIAFEDADPLVALLDIKAAQVLIAADGVPDPFVAQMGGAQADPLLGKFRVCGKEGHEI